jgi:hypothetical protein
VSRRLLPLLPAMLVLALPAAPAFAGEDPDPTPTPTPTPTPAPVLAPAPGIAVPTPVGYAKLHAPQSCKAGHRLKAWVTGDNIESVAFYVEGKLVTTDRRAGAGGRYGLTMSCSRLRVGANRARAAVTYTKGASPTGRTLRFSLNRLRHASPRFTG